MVRKHGHCWCKRKLIDGTWYKDKATGKSKFFPFGFANCPVHQCWYEDGDKEIWDAKQAKKK